MIFVLPLININIFFEINANYLGIRTKLFQIMHFVLTNKIFSDNINVLMKFETILGRNDNFICIYAEFMGCDRVVYWLFQESN